MVLILAVPGRQHLQHPVEIGNRARLEFDRRDGGGGTDHENRGDAGAQVARLQRGRNDVRHVVRIALPSCRDLRPVRVNLHRILVYSASTSGEKHAKTTRSIAPGSASASRTALTDTLAASRSGYP